MNKSITPFAGGAIGKQSANNTTRKKPRPATERPLKIDADLENEILKRFPKINSQYAGFARSMLRDGEVLTGQGNRWGGVNLSNLARRSINPKIKELGICADCRYPKEKISTQYKTRSGQVYWGFYKL